MRARYYNPDLKRFMNRDVVSGNIIESQTLNRYAFVNGNPISYHDPFGLAREAIANSKASLMDMLHVGLDMAGMLPVIGGVADGLNAVLYLSKGDYTNALLSGMAMIPVVGNASTVAKYADDVAFLGKKGYNEVVGNSIRKPANIDNINDFLKGNKSFDEVIDDYALLYSDRVMSNSNWSWKKSIVGGSSLITRHKRMIKEKAVSSGLIPDVKINVVDGKRFADFKGAGLVLKEKQLPSDLWLSSDTKQFEWLDNKIGGRPDGTTWHHSEVPGKMELVPYGIHNVTNHNGGRTKGMWSDAPR